MSDHESELEPIPGLPEELPPGELIVWQGRPKWTAMARDTFKIRWLTGYFAALLVARLLFAVGSGEGSGGLTQTLVMVAAFTGCLGLVALMAFLNATATVYTITTRRVVMRIGAALSMTWNLPFKRLASADLLLRSGGSGDIVLRLGEGDRISPLVLWPHVEPARWLQPAPALRAVEEPERVAKILREAVNGWSAEESAPVVLGEGSFDAPHSNPVEAQLAPQVSR